MNLDEMRRQRILFDTPVRIGIENGFLPKSFQSVLGNPTIEAYMEAYEQGEEEEFDFSFPTVNADYKKQAQTFFQKFTPYHQGILATYPFENSMNIFRNRVYDMQYNILFKFPRLYGAMSAIFYYMLQNRIELTEIAQQTILKVTKIDITKKLTMSGLNGGKIAKENTWIKPAATVAVIGTVIGVGVWKKDEIMAAFKGKKSKSVNGLNGTKNNKGLKKMLAINKSAKALQKQSGYEMRNVKEVEVKTVKKMMPKLSWKEAQKRAKNLYR